MDQATHNKIVSFIWGIAVLEPTQQAVLDTKKMLDEARITEQRTTLGDAAEITFTRHFYKPPPLRTLAEIAADIVAAEKEAEDLLDDLLMAGAGS